MRAGNYGLQHHAYMLALLLMTIAEGKSKQDIAEAEGCWRVGVSPFSCLLSPFAGLFRWPFA